MNLEWINEREFGIDARALDSEVRVNWIAITGLNLERLSTRLYRLPSPHLLKVVSPASIFLYPREEKRARARAFLFDRRRPENTFFPRFFPYFIDIRFNCAVCRELSYPMGIIIACNMARGKRLSACKRCFPHGGCVEESTRPADVAVIRQKCGQLD